MPWLQLGSTSIGIRTSEGVVLAAEKRIPSKLIVPDSVEKISLVDDHIGALGNGAVWGTSCMCLCPHTRSALAYLMSQISHAVSCRQRCTPQTKVMTFDARLL